MKKIFLCAGLAAFFACNNKTSEQPAAAGPKNTDLIQQNLKGKVETITEMNVNYDSTGKAKSDSTTNEYGFDEKGYQNKYDTKDSVGKVSFEQTMKRNADGSFSEITNSKYGKQSYRLTTEVKDGMYTGAKSYDSTGKQDGYYSDLKTNEYGIVYAGKQHFMNDKIKGTFDMKYEGANFTGGVSTDSTGKEDYRGTVKLDDKGNATEETTITPLKDTTKTEVVTYKYDATEDKGNWTQRTTVSDKGKTTKVVRRVFTYYKD